MLGERRLRLYDAAFEAGEPHAAPGTIVAIDGAGMRLALIGATIIVRRARFDPNPKKAAPLELVESGELRASAKLT